MARGQLTEQEVKILMNNKYVAQVTNNNTRIFYTNEFKEHFVREYYSGKKPKKIFVEAGFDPNILGNKRIERSAARWKEKIQQYI